MAKKKPEKSLDELLEEALVKEGEEPYEVPGNWVWVKLEELFDITSSKRVFKTEWKSSGVPFYRAREIAELSVKDKIDNELFISKEMYEDYSKKYGVPNAGDILITAVGTLGKVYIVKTNDKFYFKDGNVIWLKKKNTPLKSSMIKYFFESFFMLEKIQDISTGTVVKTYTITKAKETLFPLPPLEEQKRIVKKLSSLLGKLKEARELIQEAKDTFEERRAAILNKAFTGELTKKWRDENPDVESAEKVELQETPYNLPKSWSWVRLEALFHEVKEKVVPSLEINCAYIGLENLKTGGSLADIGKSNKVKSLKTVFRSGDVLYGKLRPYLNKHTKVDFDGITSTDILVFRTKGVFSEKLLDMYLGMPRVVNYANRNSKGINLPRVSPKVMMRLLIPVPFPDEQKEIVRILEKLLDHEDEAKALIDMEEQIDLLEKSILSKAFSGELGTNDTNDEPAIELLKRSLKEKNE